MGRKRKVKTYPQASEWRIDKKLFEDGVIRYYPYRLIDNTLPDSSYDERKKPVKRFGIVKEYACSFRANEANRLHPVAYMVYDTKEECQRMVEWLEQHPETPVGKWKTVKLCGECNAFQHNRLAPRELVAGCDFPVRVGVCRLSGKRVEKCTIMHSCPKNSDISPILEN